MDRFPLWDHLGSKRIPAAWEMEFTARCNFNCRHCYINRPADDAAAREAELDIRRIEAIADQAVALGTLWVLITGGEPLLRPDFCDVYRMLKKKGLLVSVFTNAALIRKHHVEMFRRYPPRDIEVSVYGVSESIHTAVTRVQGGLEASQRGLNMLLEAGIPVRLKAMAMRANVAELGEISHFCRRYTRDYFRFDPFLHLRYDRDPVRNREIRAQRLNPAEVVAVERQDEVRFENLQSSCVSLLRSGEAEKDSPLIQCGAGRVGFTTGPDGTFRLCGAMNHPDTIYDLRYGSLEEAWNVFTPKVLSMKPENPDFYKTCGGCSLINLCMWCPANAWLETGAMDQPVEAFCEMTRARIAMLQLAENANAFK